MNLDCSPSRSGVRDASGTLTINGSDDVTTEIGNTDRGSDTIRGNDTVDCGAGNDTVYYDPGDTVRDCEVRRDLQGNPQ